MVILIAAENTPEILNSVEALKLQKRKQYRIVALSIIIIHKFLYKGGISVLPHSSPKGSSVLPSSTLATVAAFMMQ